ncbi:hypothetical protein EV191_12825 [Tamaricihabitans halophyticus]|uniref:DSBA-like thioredoxin domain-containing protein n=1 Tax=Tamaricihabitans halophyticus TaxID=1262583 RepID=A0A4R2Q2B5_9PSEU|nr:disulfide bond formation protein DsbA [Tamaricihabitans halophyticus]TCP40775.1 hypothetical protein EV191_12825 [Tamaricihabitans halophyticus]
MTEVVLYADPVCPFAWLAYRWLADCLPDGQQPELRQMSLAVLNDGRQVDPAHRRRIEDSRRVGRVRAAIDVPQAATAFHVSLARSIHERNRSVDAELLRAALAEADLPHELADTADSSEQDAAVRVAHQASQDALSEPGGSPILSIDGHAFFGPVLTELPTPAQGRALFDALSTVAAVPSFAEIRRPRAGAPAMPKG